MTARHMLSRARAGTRVPRSRFLLVLVLLAVLPLASVSAGAAGDAPAPDQSDPLSPANVTTGEFPIGLWHSPPPSETTVQRYREIAEAGFTFLHPNNRVHGVRRSTKMLRAAEANGLVATVRDRRLEDLMAQCSPFPTCNRFEPAPPDEEVRRTVREVVQDYRDFPAFAGFRVNDEPHAREFDSVGEVTRVLASEAPDALPFVNLFPSHVPDSYLGTDGYDEHVRQFIETVDPPVLSFDHYPLLAHDYEGGGSPELLDTELGRREALSRDYFANWAIIRRHALRAGIPSWVFIQSIGYKLDIPRRPERRRPNEAELRWQINTSLAYGAKGIQYFTYWTPANPITEFTPALLSADGTKTDLYYAAQRVNRYLSAIGEELLPLRSESVTHAEEEELPPGTVGFSGNRWVKAVDGDPVILGRFRARKGKSNQRWLLVSNRTFTGDADVTLTLPSNVRTVFRFHPQSGSFRTVKLPNRGRTEDAPLRVRLGPGEAQLYRLHASRNDRR